MTTITTYTASEAREKLYKLIRSASTGLGAYEIKLRGSKPVVLLSKEELESWLETIDILNSPDEMKAISSSKKEKKKHSHKDVLEMFGLQQ